MIKSLIDSHAHLELEPLVQDSVGVLERAAEAGIVAVITVGTDISDAEKALEIADRFESVFVSMGVHPHNAKEVHEDTFTMMEELAKNPKVVAYGEIGLDFFRNWSPRSVQTTVFADQLEIAKKLAKPVVIHLRNAYEEGMDMLEKAAPFDTGGVIHCFSGDQKDADRALELGFYISIPGTVTYKKNDRLRTILSKLPEDRILLETDAPFLAPEPLRGKDNEPAFMVHTARKVAEIRKVSVEEISRVTTANAIRLFRLPLKS
jgi:TatD DNase family protein